MEFLASVLKLIVWFFDGTAALLPMIGINAIFYGFFLVAERRMGTRKRLTIVFGTIFLILSLPSFLVFENSRRSMAARAASRRSEDVAKLKCICRAWCKPTRRDIDRFGFECDYFTDETGELDLKAWKEYELSKIDD